MWAHNNNCPEETMKSENYLKEVRAQYEELPYPPRTPNEENKRLLRTVADHLVVLNHHCFGGRRDFRSGFRCLVAGGGTGVSYI